MEGFTVPYSFHFRMRMSFNVFYFRMRMSQAILFGWDLHSLVIHPDIAVRILLWLLMKSPQLLAIKEGSFPFHNINLLQNLWFLPDPKGSLVKPQQLWARMQFHCFTNHFTRLLHRIAFLHSINNSSSSVAISTTSIGLHRPFATRIIWSLSLDWTSTPWLETIKGATAPPLSRLQRRPPSLSLQATGPFGSL